MWWCHDHESCNHVLLGLCGGFKGPFADSPPSLAAVSRLGCSARRNTATRRVLRWANFRLDLQRSSALAAITLTGHFGDFIKEGRHWGAAIARAIKEQIRLESSSPRILSY